MHWYYFCTFYLNTTNTGSVLSQSVFIKIIFFFSLKKIFWVFLSGIFKTGPIWFGNDSKNLQMVVSGINIIILVKTRFREAISKKRTKSLLVSRNQIVSCFFFFVSIFPLFVGRISQKWQNRYHYFGDDKDW